LLTIEGTAFDSSKGNNWVTICINDTLNKLSTSQPVDWKKIDALFKDSIVVVTARYDGRFSIKAKSTDSLTFEADRAITQSHLVTDLVKRKKINILLEPQVCEHYVECLDTLPKHFVFIAEKISLRETPDKYYCEGPGVDTEWDAEYKIIENVWGKYPADSIHFKVFDHYGRPPFGEYQHVMLFISQYCGINYHMKYQFYDVYKTVDNRWAAPYKASYYARMDATSTIKPEKISFADTVAFDLKPKQFTGRLRRYNFPEPFYKIENGKAIPLYGNYIPELLELKKQTVLKQEKLN
jgi:hypothetical protein